VVLERAPRTGDGGAATQATEQVATRSLVA
ncbi:MAG: single-stranded DNA-binding protein, partial [Hyphomicrobiales bacterium]